MRDEITELVFILDRSGSMEGLEKDTIGGFNSMLEKQRGEEGRALVSTVLFDDRIDVLHDRLDIRCVPRLTDYDYYARGCTALLDAIGSTLDHVHDVHMDLGREERPDHTMIVITTDGYENASHRYRLPVIRRMIEDCQIEHNWEFLFLGANMDAIDTAAGMGIAQDRAATYMPDARGTELNFAAIGSAISQMRCCAPMEAEGSWKKVIEEDFEARGKAKRSSGKRGRRPW